MPTNRPSDTAFHQQRLNSWRPVFTPKHFIMSLIFVGMVFLPIGILLLLEALSCDEIVLDYTNMNIRDFPPGSAATHNRDSADGPKDPVLGWTKTEALVPEGGKGRTYKLYFRLDKRIKGPTYMYYQLDNYYQNYRKYVHSLSRSQLRGERLSMADLAKDCYPVVGPGTYQPHHMHVSAGPLDSETTSITPGKDETVRHFPVFYPCGLIANTIFPDEIGLDLYHRSTEKIAVKFFTDKISMSADKYHYHNTKYELDEIRVPPSWPRNFFSKSMSSSSSLGMEKESHRLSLRKREKQAHTKASETLGERQYQGIGGKRFSERPNIENQNHLFVWLRSSMFPTIRKLYGHTDNSLEPGEYFIIVTDRFNAAAVNTKKAIVLGNSSAFGGRGLFLPLAYLFLGVLFVLTGIIFLTLNFFSPRKAGDVQYLYAQLMGKFGDSSNAVTHSTHIGSSSISAPGSASLTFARPKSVSVDAAVELEAI